jgi:hypothetical protein
MRVNLSPISYAFRCAFGHERDKSISTVPAMFYALLPVENFLRVLKSGTVDTVQGRVVMPIWGTGEFDSVVECMDGFVTTLQAMSDRMNLGYDLSFMMRLANRLDRGIQIDEQDIASLERDIDYCRRIYLACPPTIRASISNDKVRDFEIGELLMKAMSA